MPLSHCRLLVPSQVFNAQLACLSTSHNKEKEKKNIKENPAPKSNPKAVLGYLKME
jgi:hypothetical protein